MSIDVRIAHPDYAKTKLSIMAARDAFLGERAIKGRADLYLPRLSGQTVVEYNAYKMRATFYSIVSRTIGALTGLAVQGDPRIVGNEETVLQMEDSEHGMQLFESRSASVSELLLQGRYGILLDAPDQADTVGLYGYVSDAIINWETNKTDEYTMLVLQESRLVTDPTNRFKKDLQDQYRVLELQNGVYTVTIYDKDSKQLTSIQPTFMGKTIDYIPFYTAKPDGLSTGVTKSPMEDMVSINMSHYRTSADLEHGRHFVGLPTPVITGSEVQGKMRIGGSQAWVLPEKDSKAYYLEFKGEGLKSLETALTEKEAQLSSLSSNIISRSIRGSESPDAIRLRMSSETASLYTIVKTVQTLLNLVWNTKSALEGNPRDIGFSFPTQFVHGQLTAEEIQKYSKVYLDGGLPLKDYVAILRRGGALAADRPDGDVSGDLEKLTADRIAREQQALAQKQQPTPPHQ